MAWYNPSTWSFVDQLQGQKAPSNPAGGGGGGGGWGPPSTPVIINTGQKKVDTSEADKYDKIYQDALAALTANRTPVPRFINYDITASWDKARQEAAKAVSPVYKQKMTDFINRQKQELIREKEDVTSGKSALDLALGRLLEDTQTQRTRTTADTETNIADINAARAYEARGEGLNFDAANRSLVEGVGAAGLAESGLGQQQIQEAQAARRDMSNEQVRQSANKVEAANTLMNRTFEDLELKETRGEADTTQSKSKLDIDLERFIEDQKFEKDQKTKELEYLKQAEIAEKAVGVQRGLVDQWIASLSGQGYTAQEVANAAAMYK